jgi:hypothetical protein
LFSTTSACAGDLSISFWRESSGTGTSLLDLGVEALLAATARLRSLGVEHMLMGTCLCSSTLIVV